MCVLDQFHIKLMKTDENKKHYTQKQRNPTKHKQLHQNIMQNVTEINGKDTCLNQTILVLHDPWLAKATSKG